MPSLIDEQTQFTDTDGLPIVNGSLYIGTQNSDPVANPITIYSDRDLTTPISNPQSLDSYGRSTNKIWIPGKYSLQVNNSASVQKYQALDAGDVTQTGISVLSNVQGTNTITAEGSPAIATLVDQQQYNFTTASANTGAVTLQIDLTAAKSILKQHDVALVSGDLEANQIVSVIYNGTDDAFELVSNALTSEFTNLTVSSSFTYAGEVQPPILAAVTNYTRAGNIQWRTGTPLGSFSVVSNLTAGVAETVGPTGSSATNIWTAMDELPSTATILIIYYHINITSGAAGNTVFKLEATEGDGTIGSGFDVIAQQQVDADASGEFVQGYGTAWIPLEPTNQDFLIEYTLTNPSGIGFCEIYVQGFVTD